MKKRFTFLNELKSLLMDYKNKANKDAMQNGFYLNADEINELIKKLSFCWNNNFTLEELLEEKVEDILSTYEVIEIMSFNCNNHLTLEQLLKGKIKDIFNDNELKTLKCPYRINTEKHLFKNLKVQKNEPLSYWTNYISLVINIDGKDIFFCVDLNGFVIIKEDAKKQIEKKIKEQMRGLPLQKLYCSVLQSNLTLEQLYELLLRIQIDCPDIKKCLYLHASDIKFKNKILKSSKEKHNETQKTYK